MREINKLIIHCSDSPQGRGDDADTIRRWHKERGWSDIGYHYVIVEDGDIQVGRDLERSGAHAKGHNSNSIGICLIGQTSFTDEQFVSLGTLVIGMMEQFNVKIEDVIGHYDVSSKTCPNFNVKDFLHKYVLSEDTV